MQRKALRYDKAGDQHYDYISAWIKSTRGSDPDASLYYLAAMLEGGEDAALHRPPDGRSWRPRTSATRTRRRCSVAVAAAHAVEHVGLPECTFALAQAAIYLSLAPKSNAAGKRARRRPARTSASTARRSRRPRCARPPTRPRASSAAASATTTRTTTRATSTTRSTCPTGVEHLRFYDPGDAEPRAARAAGARSASRAAATRERRRRRARQAQPLWSLLPVDARARYIRRAAVALLDELDDLALRLAERDRLAARAARAVGAAAGGARAARAGRRRAARARRHGALTPRARWLGRALHAARAGAGRAWSACAGRPPRRGPSRRWRPPPRCWRATPCCSRGARRSACAACSCARACPGELLTVAPADADLDAVCRRVVDLPRPGRLGTLLVLDGAPRERVVEAALWAGFGRHPAAAGRLVVVAGAVPGLVEALQAAASALRVGDPRDPDDRSRRAAARRARGGGRPALRRPAAGPVLAVVEVPDTETGDRARRARGPRRARSRSGPATRRKGERVARRLPSPATWVGRHGIAPTAVAGADRAPRRRRASSSGARRGRRARPAARRPIAPRGRRWPRSATGARRAGGRRCGRLRRGTRGAKSGEGRRPSAPAPPLRTHPSRTQGPLAAHYRRLATAQRRSVEAASGLIECLKRDPFRHSSQAPVAILDVVMVARPPRP